MSSAERALLFAVARALASLMGWGSASPQERHEVLVAIRNAEKEAK